MKQRLTTHPLLKSASLHRVSSCLYQREVLDEDAAQPPATAGNFRRQTGCKTSRIQFYLVWQTTGPITSPTSCSECSLATSSAQGRATQRGVSSVHDHEGVSAGYCNSVRPQLPKVRVAGGSV
jgi:hypothetical protein